MQYGCKVSIKLVWQYSDVLGHFMDGISSATHLGLGILTQELKEKLKQLAKS